YNSYYPEIKVTTAATTTSTATATTSTTTTTTTIVTNASYPYEIIDSNCTHALNVKELLYSNIYWQKMVRANRKPVYLYSSYYDNRTFLNNNPVVRIITFFYKPSTPVNFYCYLWFENDDYATISKITLVSRASVRQFGIHENPYIITCPIPRKVMHKIPISVSLSIKQCGFITNLLPVVNNQPEKNIKKDFAVCIKALDYVDVDMSFYMVEWLELLFLMGVDKVFAYEYTVHSNISKVLKHYVDIGRLSVTPITLPGNASNDPILRHQYLDEKVWMGGKFVYINQILHEKIPMNDCFYRNINLYKYVAIMDLDEIIIARKVQTWKEMMNIVTVNGLVSRSSYRFKRTIVLDSMRQLHGWSENVPKYMYMSQNIYRSPVYEKDPKSIYNTERIISLGTHAARACLHTQGGNITKCNDKVVKPGVAHVLHYRGGCKKGKEKFCIIERSIKDEVIWRYREQLIKQTSHTLKKLGLLF
ncbi:unnamed protein product, partial [Meganyctiphanes norvegica]